MHILSAMNNCIYVLLSVWKQVDDLLYIRGVCAASQRQKTYDSHVVVTRDGAVVTATCQCTMG